MVSIKLRRFVRKLNGREDGFTLIEVLCALAIMGLIAGGFLSALSTSFQSLIVAREQTVAESLARSQMESIKNQGFNLTGTYTPIESPTGYEITVLASGHQAGIQKITVIVNHQAKPVIILDGYKGDR